MATVPDEWALTPREQVVLSLMAEGLSNLGIAQRLHLSERTIEKASTDVLWKTTGKFYDRAPLVNRRVLAVLAYLREAAVDALDSPERDT